MPEISMVAMNGHTSQGDTYIDGDGMVDAAGNRFSLLGMAQPGAGNTTFLVLKKIYPNGTVEEWRFLPSGNQKIDKCNLLRSGNDVIVEAITHEITSTKPRRLEKQTGVVLDVFITTTSFEAEESGAGAWMPGSGGGGGEMDPEQLRPIIREEIRAALGLAPASVNLKQEFSGSPTGNYRQALEDKARDCIREDGVITLNNIYSSAGLYQRFVETTYEQVMKGLNEKFPTVGTGDNP